MKETVISEVFFFLLWHVNHFLDLVFSKSHAELLQITFYTILFPSLGEKLTEILWNLLCWYWDCFCSLNNSIVIRSFLSIPWNYVENTCTEK